MKKYLLLLFAFFFWSNTNAQITLSHNVGNIPIKTDWVNCEEEQSWSKVFNLEDFGITSDEQFIIKSGKTAISNAKLGSGIHMSISIIDEDFPNSNIIHNNGSYRQTPEIGDIPEILSFEFSSPIVIPSGVKRILVTVNQTNISNTGEIPFLIAGTQEDNDVSWFSGCRKYYTYIETKNLDNPKPNANFFINVTGEKINAISSLNNKILSHNTNDDLIETRMHSCSSAYQYWSRNFKLSDFGISNNEEYIIRSGQVGINKVGWQANLTFNIYKIDDNFPNSFSEENLIGSSQTIEPWPGIGRESQIINIEFETPVTVPAGVERILVEVKKGVSYGDGIAFIAGTDEDKDDSWYKGCGYSGTPNKYTTLNSFNFFITVNGESKPIFPFEITSNNNCINFSNNFSLTNQTEIKSVIWSFDDPSSGTNNTSTLLDVSHQFSKPGIYNVTATVLHTDGTNYTIPEEVEIFDAPVVNSNVKLKQCDNNIDGFSFFNLTEVNEKIINNSSNYIITYFETETQAKNNDTPITNFTTYENQIISNDVVWARIENLNGCFRTSQIDLIVSTTQIPLTYTKEFYECDNGVNTTDGIATFDFSKVTSEIIAIFPVNQQLIIKYYQSEDDALAEINAIPEANISNYQNTGSPNQQKIYIRVDSVLDNDCLGLGHHITLNVETQPIANPITITPKCDNDSDGLFAFDTAIIQNTIIGNQTNISVSYFDKNGGVLPSPLPNPFLSATQTITAKVINSNNINETCFDETSISFIVNTVPVANPVSPLEQCDNDTDGIVAFDTSTLESTILGTQTGMIVKYFNESGTPLSSPLPNPFETNSQTIKVRIENPEYTICSVETTIDFIVREKPTVQLPIEMIICMTNTPSLNISVNNPKSDYTYTWFDSNNIQLKTGEIINVNKGGLYSVIAASQYNCKSEKATINVIESQSATFFQTDILITDDSDNNTITINTSNLGLGDYEYALLDIDLNIVSNYQNSPVFENLEGGIYTVSIKDKNDCGTKNEEVSLITYPHFFTPNNDGLNDFWEIKGFNTSFYPLSKIYIYNRFGKIVAKLPIENPTWNGLSDGNQLPSNDYWFSVQLIDRNGNTRTKKGHFSILRK